MRNRWKIYDENGQMIGEVDELDPVNTRLIVYKDEDDTIIQWFEENKYVKYIIGILFTHDNHELYVKLYDFKSFVFKTNGFLSKYFVLLENATNERSVILELIL